MTPVCAARTVAWRAAIGGVIVLGLMACGGASSRASRTAHGMTSSRAGSRIRDDSRPRARIPLSRAAAMRPTPREALILCRANPLLRRVCPRQIPVASMTRRSDSRQSYYCDDGDPRETARQSVQLFPTMRCVWAEWGYEVAAPVPGVSVGDRITAWDGREWFVPEYAPLDPPPWYLHIDIQASIGAPLPGGGFRWPGCAQPVSDVLLNPSRNHAVSLGWVSWFGQDGQLVMSPTSATGGLWAGHLVFAFTRDKVEYAITLHAWTAKEWISRGNVSRIVTFEPGQALPHVIATLKAIVGSVLRR
jgi:hypothetical protein